MPTDSVAVVDGSNIAYTELSANGDPKVSNIVAVCRDLRDRGYRPVVIVDASLRHEIDDPDQLEALLDDQDVRQAPAGTQADYFVLEVADELGALVISNDGFDEYREQYPWIDERRVPLMIVGGEVMLHEPSLRQNRQRAD
ncbi:MAG TPA: hypothetical protein GX714_14410 [Chloroflexi bacterium]|jgi:hypothetical protein|nr:hypothetical protein [Chloroflexota bacterium]